ncbi:MAG TPA: hypothetical protein VIY49_39230 [Bryobacteraceae bacterium]
MCTSVTHRGIFLKERRNRSCDMNPPATSSIVFACLVVGTSSGLLLRTVLPPHHLSEQSKDTIKLTAGLIGTMVALILGLLVASAKTFFDTQSAELAQSAAQVVMLDHILAYYGPETKRARDILYSSTGRVLERLSSQSTLNTSSAADPASVNAESLAEAILQLSPQNEIQRALRQNAISTMYDVGQRRWLMYEQTVSGLPRPLLVVMVVWLGLLFLSFGLLTPPNATAITSLFLAAMSVSSAILMILDMYSPYRGLIQVSREPLRVALVHLGR